MTTPAQPIYVRRDQRSRKERLHIEASIWGYFLSSRNEATVTLDDGTQWIILNTPENFVWKLVGINEIRRRLHERKARKKKESQSGR